MLSDALYFLVQNTTVGNLSWTCFKHIDSCYYGYYIRLNHMTNGMAFIQLIMKIGIDTHKINNTNYKVILENRFIYNKNLFKINFDKTAL